MRRYGLRSACLAVGGFELIVCQKRWEKDLRSWPKWVRNANSGHGQMTYEIPFQLEKVPSRVRLLFVSWRLPALRCNLAHTDFDGLNPLSKTNDSHDICGVSSSVSKRPTTRRLFCPVCLSGPFGVLLAVLLQSALRARRTVTMIWTRWI